MGKRCSQCRTPAVVELGGHYLCVSCYSKVKHAEYLEFAQDAALINQALGDIENTVGLPGFLGRVEIPMPTTINAGQSTFNNIRVDNSVVGSINTGNIKKLDIMMSKIGSTSNRRLADALQRLTQAILDTRELHRSDKDTALEWLSFLSTQALTQQTERQSKIGREAISTLERILSNTGGIASIWSAVKPHLAALF